MEQSDKTKKDELPQPKIFMTCLGVGGLLVQFQVEALDKQKAGHAIKAASKMMAMVPFVAVEEIEPEVKLTPNGDVNNHRDIKDLGDINFDDDNNAG